MNPYENVSMNPRGGNGSAFDLMSQFTHKDAGTQASSFPGQGPWQQNAPFTGQSPLQFNPQQNPYQQQFFNPASQPPNFFQQPPWPGFISGQQGGFATPQGNYPFWGAQAMQFQPVQQQPPVITTKSVEVNLNVPTQRVIGRHPQEIQQYVLNFVVPVLLDGLIKRALTQDIGQSVSSDFRECVVRIQI